tara:strand:- start:4987 stop:5649 length:663 start_codon:yes stop_codon:yes gene_type:complete
MKQNKQYCVYLTIYRGNKLPPFYIGSTHLENIKSGYKGTVSSLQYKKIFINEIKLHSELFETKIISFCDTRNEALKREEEIQRQFSVISNSLYTNKGYATNGCFGISMKGKNNPFYGKKHNENSKNKMSKARTGKKRPFSEEHKRNISKAVTESYDDALREKRSKVHKGKIVSEETRKKMSISHKGKSSSRKGICLSEETKEKLRVSAHKRHAKKMSEKT